MPEKQHSTRALLVLSVDSLHSVLEPLSL